MSDTPRTDAADLYDYQTAVEVCGELERELANAIAERDSETRWADKYAAESYRLEMICQNAHDRLLRGDTDKELLAILEEAWKGRGVAVEDRRARTSNPTGLRCAGLDAHKQDPVVGLPPVLDACCGGRMFWFDHCDKRALFCDRRRAFREVDIGTPGTKGRKPLVVEPDMIADFTAMPFPSDSFALVVFDPPHLEKLGATGKYATSYGRLEGDWPEMLRAGFAECFRVLRPEGVLVFKWCEYEIPLSRVLALTPEKPLFGHISGKRQQTHWVCFMKPNPKIDGRGTL